MGFHPSQHLRQTWNNQDTENAHVCFDAREAISLSPVNTTALHVFNGSLTLVHKDQAKELLHLKTLKFSEIHWQRKEGLSLILGFYRHCFSPMNAHFQLFPHMNEMPV